MERIYQKIKFFNKINKQLENRTENEINLKTRIVYESKIFVFCLMIHCKFQNFLSKYLYLTLHVFLIKIIYPIYLCRFSLWIENFLISKIVRNFYHYKQHKCELNLLLSTLRESLNLCYKREF